MAGNVRFNGKRHIRVVRCCPRPQQEAMLSDYLTNIVAYVGLVDNIKPLCMTLSDV